MRVDQFDFDLPEDRIALRPTDPRDSARLLVVKNRTFVDYRVSDLPGLLRSGDILVVNRTRVIPARLHGTRAPRPETPGENKQPVQIEATLHQRKGPDKWAAFAKPGKKLRIGDHIIFSDSLSGEVREKNEGGEILFRFSRTGADLDIAIAECGEMPLPPYIASKRPVDDRDRTDYQTAFARDDGSVAAPTAGLHFTPGLIQSLCTVGIEIAEVTLHVGAGTFLPVKSETTDSHKMHAEWGSISSEVANCLNQKRKEGGRIIAVGTTSLRILETAATAKGEILPFDGATDIFITPGFRFKAVDGLMTNFHLPRSTLFMLVCAFSGYETMKDAYRHAIETGYRFYSYGDACLLWPEGSQ